MVRVVTRRYNSEEEASAAYERAKTSYIGRDLNISFFRFYYSPVGWMVAAVGEDATPEMLDGGEEVTPDPGLRYALLLLRVSGRPPGGGIVEGKQRPGLVIRVPRNIN